MIKDHARVLPVYAYEILMDHVNISDPLHLRPCLCDWPGTHLSLFLPKTQVEGHRSIYWWDFCSADGMADDWNDC